MSYELNAISQARVAYALPVFPGASDAARLVAGRAAASLSIRRHLPDFVFDVESASQAMRDIDAWGERNDASLQGLFADPNAISLPASLQLSLGGPERVRSFLLASFTLAASGMGPWTSGEVDRVVAAGEASDLWAGLDASSRGQIFGIIVRLDEDGNLGPLLRGEKGMAGLGSPIPVVAVVIIASVFFAAIVVTALYLNKRLELNNRLMGEMCRKAQAEGRDNVVRDCIEAMKELQSDDPLSSLTSGLVKVAAVAAVVYVGGRYALPALVEALGKWRRK
jgi:hypothetical protein